MQKRNRRSKPIKKEQKEQFNKKEPQEQINKKGAKKEQKEQFNKKKEQKKQFNKKRSRKSNSIKKEQKEQFNTKDQKEQSYSFVRIATGIRKFSIFLHFSNFVLFFPEKNCGKVCGSASQNRDHISISLTLFV